jgi:hypothetical protein
MKREFLVILLIAVAFGGCAGKSGQATVSGNVTLDGRPLKAGQIRFVPADGQGTTAGTAIATGKFTALVPPGEKKVEITASKVVGKRKMYQTPDSPEVDVVEELLPPRYHVQTELKLTVGPGAQEQNFDLKSK